MITHNDPTVFGRSYHNNTGKDCCNLDVGRLTSSYKNLLRAQICLFKLFLALCKNKTFSFKSSCIFFCGTSLFDPFQISQECNWPSVLDQQRMVDSAFQVLETRIVFFQVPSFELVEYLGSPRWNTKGALPSNH